MLLPPLPLRWCADLNIRASVRIDGPKPPPVVTAAITGSLRVAVHDERGDLVQGRSLEDSLPMLLDAVDEEVQWKGAADPIPDRCVLKVEVKDATLFSFGWIGRARDRRQKRVYRERRRVAKATATRSAATSW